ncbi:hypothetical protein [Treponema sp.]|uniref:hypothetical protein n=1 Tax=Treponema sp. TaxID=166 RepID=UPI00257B4E05|nr:hypothetical protein [Treponema sp.]MBE6355251.1 hypothetical protein [Treponema sp.]
MRDNLLEKEDMSFLVDAVIRKNYKQNYKWRYALTGNYIPLQDSYDFEPFTKLYCAPINVDGKIDRFAVIGKAKSNTNTFIETIVSEYQIINLRLRRVFVPGILDKMNNSVFRYFGNTHEDFKEICSLLINTNPLYIIHKGDRKYSLDTGENEQLKLDIRKNSETICNFLRSEIRTKDKYSMQLLQQLENEINIYKWAHMEGKGFLDICASYLGDLIINRFGGCWSVVNKRLCIMVTGRACIFIKDLITMYYCADERQGLEKVISKIEETVL